MMHIVRERGVHFKYLIADFEGTLMLLYLGTQNMW